MVCRYNNVFQLPTANINQQKYNTSEALSQYFNKCKITYLFNLQYEVWEKSRNNNTICGEATRQRTCQAFFFFNNLQIWSVKDCLGFIKSRLIVIITNYNYIIIESFLLIDFEK